MKKQKILKNNIFVYIKIKFLNSTIKNIQKIYTIMKI